MKITLETEWLTIIVQIVDGQRALSYALLIPKLSGEAVRLTVPEMCEALEKAARR